MFILQEWEKTVSLNGNLHQLVYLEKNPLLNSYINSDKLVFIAVKFVKIFDVQKNNTICDYCTSDLINIDYWSFSLNCRLTLYNLDLTLVNKPLDEDGEKVIFTYPISNYVSLTRNIDTPLLTVVNFNFRRSQIHPIKLQITFSTFIYD